MNGNVPSFDEHIHYIRENAMLADVYSQLAEEAVELSMAAAKMARILRGTNPTPVSRESAEENLIEEYTDVLLVSRDILDLKTNDVIRGYKLYRWKKRLEEKASESQ